jgi:transcriptional regulator with XRE-family HTH domain
MMVQRKGLAEHDQRMVGKRLIALREAKDWKQITFAKKLGVSAQRLNNWENGNNLIRIEWAIRVGEITGTHIMFIYQGIMDSRIEPELMIRLTEELRKLGPDLAQWLERREAAGGWRALGCALLVLLFADQSFLKAAIEVWGLI